jgi:hypothetical protein
MRELERVGAGTTLHDELSLELTLAAFLEIRVIVASMRDVISAKVERDVIACDDILNWEIR